MMSKDRFEYQVGEQQKELFIKQGQLGRYLYGHLSDDTGTLEDEWDDYFAPSPICCAAAHGRESIVRILLDRRVDPGRKCRSGKTPLELAAQNGHENIVILLFDTCKDTFDYMS